VLPAVDARSDAARVAVVELLAFKTEKRFASVANALAVHTYLAACYTAYVATDGYLAALAIIFSACVTVKQSLQSQQNVSTHSQHS
jgi:hypothetical protein